MVRIQYQLLKDNEPIALGSMVHCLDVFYWEIYYGCNHLAYDIVDFRQDEEVYRKARAFDEIVIETTGAIMNCPPGAVETEAGRLTLDIIEKYDMEDK